MPNDFKLLVKIVPQKTHPTGLYSESHFSIFQLCPLEMLIKPSEPLLLGGGGKGVGLPSLISRGMDEIDNTYHLS